MIDPEKFIKRTKAKHEYHVEKGHLKEGAEEKLVKGIKTSIGPKKRKSKVSKQAQKKKTILRANKKLNT